MIIYYLLISIYEETIKYIFGGLHKYAILIMTLIFALFEMYIYVMVYASTIPLITLIYARIIAVIAHILFTYGIYSIIGKLYISYVVSIGVHTLYNIIDVPYKLLLLFILLILYYNFNYNEGV